MVALHCDNRNDLRRRYRADRPLYGRLRGCRSRDCNLLFTAEIGPFYIAHSSDCVTCGFVIVVLSLNYAAPGQSFRDRIRDRVALSAYPDTGSGLLVPYRILPVDLHKPESARLTKWRQPSQQLPDVALNLTAIPSAGRHRRCVRRSLRCVTLPPHLEKKS